MGKRAIIMAGGTGGHVFPRFPWRRSSFAVAGAFTGWEATGALKPGRSPKPDLT